MKRMILMLIIVALATTMSFGQNPTEIANDTTTKVAVFDTTIVNDMKLLIVADRLYIKGGLVDVLIEQASKEKSETGEIKYQEATQAFLDALNNEYSKFLKAFIKVDTVMVEQQAVESKIQEIETWQQSVINDPEIKNATSLGIWEEKSKELNKLKAYDNQIKQKDK